MNNTSNFPTLKFLIFDSIEFTFSSYFLFYCSPYLFHGFWSRNWVGSVLKMWHYNINKYFPHRIRDIYFIGHRKSQFIFWTDFVITLMKCKNAIWKYNWTRERYSQYCCSKINQKWHVQPFAEIRKKENTNFSILLHVFVILWVLAIIYGKHWVRVLRIHAEYPWNT